MARYKKSYSRKSSQVARTKFITLFLIVGMIGIFGVTLAATRLNTDLRSRATVDQLIGKQWEFNGTSTEGWTGQNITNLRVISGLLIGSIGNLAQVPTLLHNSVNTQLPLGKKIFWTNFAIASPRLDGTATPVRTVSLKVYYWLTGKSSWERPLLFTSEVGGKMIEFKIPFPELTPLPIAKMKIEIGGVPPNQQVQIDFIRLVSIISPTSNLTIYPTRYLTIYPSQTRYITPTRYPTTYPSPTIKPITPTWSLCRTGVTSINFLEPCLEGYRYVYFTCADGTTQKQGSSTSCKPPDVWKQYAEETCKNKTNCPLTPYPTFVVQ